MDTATPNLHAGEPAKIVDALLGKTRRVLLFGQAGIGKSTLAAALARHLHERDRGAWCLSADPGSPAFGVPGAINLGHWDECGWAPNKMEALCTLDAARFRLPLISAVRCLADGIEADTLLLDAPGVIRGVAGAELLVSLAEVANIDLVLVLTREGRLPSLQHEIQTLGIEVAYVQAHPKAARPGKMTRAKNRTRLWDAYLDGVEEHRLDLRQCHPLGTPPRDAPEAWRGKQAAFLERGRTLAMGEVIDARDGVLKIHLPAGARPTNGLLIRDAVRDTHGLLTSSAPFADQVVRYVPPPDLLPDGVLPTKDSIRPTVRLGTATAALVNGVFGDPLLHLRLGHQRRSLLFDLGEGSRLPTRIAHQVTDVFISHAHIDHIAGFLWLLRSRIGEKGVCRLYGPPGLAGHISGLIGGIHWDRIGDRGPRFSVAELHEDRLRTYHLQAGRPGMDFRGEQTAQAGVLLEEPAFRVRTTTLDHGTPVLAFAFEPAMQIHVRKERLLARGLEPGPWLTELKARILAGDHQTKLPLPDGTTESVAQLADELTLTSEGDHLVYATDFADTAGNRARLQSLAKGAHTLFCEATFLQRDATQAQRTGHLTTRACGEIANAAGVQYLIPFHFSRRYEKDVWEVYREIAAVSPQVVAPKRGG